MIKVVIDTNVLVSAMLTPSGIASKVLDMVFADTLQIIYSLESLSEYKDVLSRPKFNIPDESRNDFFNSIFKSGKLTVPIPSTMPMPDESDRTFYDTAKECGATLITFNLKDYPAEPSIMTPVEFLEKVANG